MGNLEDSRDQTSIRNNHLVRMYKIIFFLNALPKPYFTILVTLASYDDKCSRIMFG